MLQRIKATLLEASHLSKPHASSVRIMSKKAGKGSAKESSKKAKPGGDSSKPATSGPVFVDAKTGNIIVKILAKPGAKTNGITDVSEEGVGCQIAAPPIDGEANTELIKYLSKLLELRKSDISLDRGSKSRQKTIVLDKSGCSHSPEHLLAIFRKEATET